MPSPAPSSAPTAAPTAGTQARLLDAAYGEHLHQADLLAQAERGQEQHDGAERDPIADEHVEAARA